MKLITPAAIAFIVCLYLPQCLWGQTFYRVKNITVEDGISQSSIRTIAQDSLGFLWVGTNDGLNRYDGKTIKIYRAEKGDSTSLASSYASCIRNSPGNKLWIGIPGGLARYRLETDDFINYPFTDENEENKPVVFDIEFITETTLWVSTVKGLYSFDSETGTYAVVDDIFQQLIVRNVFRSPISGIWVATNKGLFHKDVDQTIWRHYTTANGLSNNYIQTIHEDSTGLLVGTIANLDIYDRPSDSFVPLKGAYKKTRGPIQGLIRDKSGNLWIAAQNTLLLDSKNNPLTLSAINSNQRNEGLTSVSEALCILETKDGTIWIGKSTGLLEYVGASTFKSVPLELLDPNTGAALVSSCFTEDDTTIYVGSFNGLNVVNLKTNEIRNYFRPKEDEANLQSHIDVITKDSRGNFWLGTGNGLLHFASDPAKAKHFLKGGVGNENLILSIKELNSSTLLLSVLYKGLWFYDHTKDSITKKITIDASALALLVDKDLIYVGSRNRLKIFNTNGTLLRESKPLSPFIRRIKDIKKDSKGRFWVATEGDGFYRWFPEKEEFISYSVKQGLSNPVVYRIEEDQTGNLWMSTNKGLSVFNPTTEKFMNFGIEDGLQSLEFNTGASFLSDKGIMYFGGLRGLNFFKPEELFSDLPPAETYISSISVNNKEYKSIDADGKAQNILLVKEIDLPYTENNIAFKFTSLDYVHPHRVRYQCQLENFTQEWIDLEDRDYISFTNLPPGEYILHVRTASGNGIPHPSIAMMRLTIHAPFWLKAEYQIIGFILFTLFGFIFYKVRVRHLKNARKRLEGIVKLRTKEIQQQKEEIASQNEELVSQTELLAEKNRELELKSTELEILTHQLEDKIAERTQKLNLLNRDLLEQNIRLEQFNFITAHNLRGPIASLKGLINIFPTLEDNESRELLRRIDGCSDRLFEIVNDLTVVLGIRGGAQNTFESVHLKQELLITLASLREAIQSKNILVDYSNVDEKVTISGIRTYIQSIFYNLLNNAIKYSRQEVQPIIEIGCRLEDGKVKIKIQDNGIGIDMQYAEGKVFQLYQRFNTHTQGKGLGLFLVKNEVDTMGGTIWLESSLNKGTTIFIEFDELKEINT